MKKLYFVRDNSTGELLTSIHKSFFISIGHIKTSNVYGPVKNGTATIFEYDLSSLQPKIVNTDNSRRNDISTMHPAEYSIYKSMQEVESLPASEKLTDAIVLLDKAKKIISDYIDENKI